MDDDEIGRLRSAISKLSRKLNVTATHEALTPTQASVLGVIVTRGPVSLSDLVGIEGIHPTMLSRVVGRLVSGNLIVRGQEPDDLRSVTVKATRTGRATHARIRAEKAAVVRECVARLATDQAAALAAALPALEALAAELQRVGS